jgi:hypothetical protein
MSNPTITNSKRTSNSDYIVEAEDIGGGVLRQTVKVSNQDALAEYRASDSEMDTTSYYGFLTTTGAWYIMKDTGTSYRYAKGDSDYPTAWTGRAALTYDYYNEVFG